MPLPLKVLIADDNPIDAELILHELRRAGFDPSWERVETEAAYVERLHAGLDLILSDYNMPQFGGSRALKLLKESGLEIPFILISGTIGEYTAVEAMKEGAADYLIKDRLGRLGVAVTHALEESRLRHARRLADEALRASERRFQALFEHAAVGVALADAVTGRFSQVNLRFCEIIGRTRQEVEQLTFAAVTHPEDRARDAETSRLLRSGAIREATREKRYLRKDGSDVWVNLTVSAMWAPGETPDYFIAVVEDITVRKQLEEQYRQAQKMDAIGTLAGGIAHDFNNILAAIIGYTELARMLVKDEPTVCQHLGVVLRAASRATDLIRQILTFSRQQPVERRPIQLLPVVAETIALLRATLPSTIEFDTSLAMDAPTVLADPTQIHQILMNLGTNAWHAMKDRPGRLEVKLALCTIDAAQAAAQPRLPAGDYAQVSVRDTGTGMDQATLRRIFEPFFTTKPLGEGTGLGLAVLHGIMHNHDGVVVVDSHLGEGTIFRLYFPAHSGEAVPSFDKDVATPRGHGERLLVVDDEEIIAELMQQALNGLGYQVECATQSAAALALVTADPRRFDLLLTDQTMPGMTGLLLAAKVRQIRADLPVIMMTGYTTASMRAGVEAAGICGILPKPITIHALGVAVAAALAPGPALLIPV